jgi:hypothetical protein
VGILQRFCFNFQIFLCVMSAQKRCMFSRNQDDLPDDRLPSLRVLDQLSEIRGGQSGDPLNERHRITPFLALRSPTSEGFGLCLRSFDHPKGIDLDV